MTEAIFDLDRHLLQRVEWPGPMFVIYPVPKGITRLGQEGFAMQIMKRCRERIVDRISKGPQAFSRKGVRCVRLWEALEISVSEDGRRLDARSIEPHAESRPALNANLTRPLAEHRWLGVFEPMFANVYRELVPDLPRRQFPRWIAEWARPSLGLTFADHIDYAGLRRAILDFLSPDLLTRSIANRIVPGEVPTEILFNWVGAHRESLAVAAVENPGWLPWLSLIRYERGHGDPLAVLERRMAEAGITPGAFRRLPEWGVAAMGALGDMAGLVPRRMYAECANLLERIDARGPVPTAFMDGFVAAALDEEFQVDPRRIALQFPDWFARALWKELPRVEDSAILQAQFDRAQAWLAIARPRPDANQRRAGWEWIARQSAAWPRYPAVRQARREELEAGMPARIRLGPWVAVRLEQPVDVVAEGVAMYNCLSKYAAGFLEAGHRIYSIRDATTGARAACMSLVLREADADLAWVLDELGGQFNSSVPIELKRVAAAVVDACNAPLPSVSH